MELRDRLNDFAIALLFIGAISLYGNWDTTPVVPNPDTEPDTTVTVPVQQPALIIVDDFEDQRTSENAYIMHDMDFVKKFHDFAPNRFRYWDDTTEPRTDEYKKLMAMAVEAGGGINGDKFPTYAIAKDGKAESGKFDATQVDQLLEKWGK